MYSAGRRRTIIILFITSLILITIDSRDNVAFDAARTAFGTVLRPFNAAGDVVARPVRRVWTGVAEADDLRAENEDLRRQLDESTADLIAAENAIVQANELKQVVGLDQLAQYQRVTGNIIGESPSNFDQQVELGVGTNKGVRVGMPVLSGGLVGKVTKVEPESCVVMLLRDPSYAVRVKIVGEEGGTTETSAPEPTTPSGLPVDEVEDIVKQSTPPPTTVPPSTEPGAAPTTTTTTTTIAPDPAAATTTTSATTTTTTTPIKARRETGSLTGMGGDRLPAVMFVSESQRFGEIEIGDAVLTTGGRFSLAPPEIPVGRVANIIRDGGVNGVVVEVEPSADLEQLNFLTVLLYQPSTELGDN